MPKCGFDGSLCDYTIFFVIGGIILFLSILIPLSYFIYIKEYVLNILFLLDINNRMLLCVLGEMLL